MEKYLPHGVHRRQFSNFNFNDRIIFCWYFHKKWPQKSTIVSRMYWFYRVRYNYCLKLLCYYCWKTYIWVCMWVNRNFNAKSYGGNNSGWTRWYVRWSLLSVICFCYLGSICNGSLFTSLVLNWIVSSISSDLSNIWLTNSIFYDSGFNTIFLPNRRYS